MKKPSEIEEIGLAFFGRISASLSHDIKNTLAVINENAGLLEDLALLAEKGVPLSFERLQRLSKTIKKQVDRADTYVKKMNRFSHTADRTLQPVDIYETAVFITDVCNRMISMRDTTVTVVPPETPIVVVSHLFYLEQLIWACIDFIIKTGGAGQTVTLTFEKQPRGAQIRLCGLVVPQTISTEIFPSDVEKVLQETLHAGIRMDMETKEILIVLPHEIR